MKLTKSKLKQLIKEELNKVLETREEAGAIKGAAKSSMEEEHDLAAQGIRVLRGEDLKQIAQNWRGSIQGKHWRRKGGTLGIIEYHKELKNSRAGADDGYMQLLDQVIKAMWGGPTGIRKDAWEHVDQDLWTQF
jgi:hypothetical protein